MEKDVQGLAVMVFKEKSGEICRVKKINRLCCTLKKVGETYCVKNINGLWRQTIYTH